MKNKVVILAAGKGTRMGSDLPKVLVEINGLPMIEHLVKAILKSGIDNRPTVIVSPVNKGIISEKLEKYNLEYVIQEEQLGTGHAVSVTKDSIPEDVDNVFVFSGDQPFVTAESMVGLANVHKMISMLVVDLEDFDDWRSNFYHLGRVIKDANKIKEIIEFKDAGDEVKTVKSINPAFYAFNRKWLFENIINLKDNNSQKEFYITDLIKMGFEQNIEINFYSIGSFEALGVNTVIDLENAKKAIQEKYGEGNK